MYLLKYNNLAFSQRINYNYSLHVMNLTELLLMTKNNYIFSKYDLIDARNAIRGINEIGSYPKLHLNYTLGKMPE